MKKDTKMPTKHWNTIKRVQKCPAFRGGMSSMGSRFKKGDVIVHLSSARSTGEVFTLTMKDLGTLVGAKPSRYRSAVKWGKELAAAWNKRRAAQVAANLKAKV